MSPALNSIRVPWGAWYQDTQHELLFPNGCALDVLAPHGGNVLSPNAIRDAVAAPIESPSLLEIAASGRSACLVIDDLARPTKASEILPVVIEELQRGGISSSEIRIVIATGSHAGLSQKEIAWKVGTNIANGYAVESHDCRAELTPTGIAYGDQELRLNRTFMASDVKVAVGSVLPHSFAGYSGGAKLVLPGLTDLDSIGRSHKFVQLGLRGGGDPNANGFRTEAEEISKRAGLQFAICVVTDTNRDTIGLFAGDVVAAHRAACEQARTAFATPVSQSYDCVVLNSFPKDCDLIQAMNSFVAWKTATKPVVRDEGLIVLASACSQGLGEHGLFGPGGTSHRSPGKLRTLRDRDLWIYTPGLSDEVVHQFFWEGYRVFHDAQTLARALAERLPERASIGVFPCAPMQQVQQPD